ncbi:MAG: hypothetical protein K6U10_05880 [Acidobacteriia bacterium]|nr:hypothetical protein [Methyloceanibacter sp.]MCL6491334.1 hypothetical protein [Terriglobia bacterium]
MSSSASNAAKVLTELKVSGHLMTLDTGLFCVVQTPSARHSDDGSGLPGVRISLPPGEASNPEAVSISSFRPDGWLSGPADAALIRVSEGPAQVLVTIYQAPNSADSAPRLQVIRLNEDTTAMPAQAPQMFQAQPVAAGPARGAMPMPPNMVPAQPLAAAPSLVPAPGVSGAVPETLAHVQIRGDVGASLGEWVGERGSKRWIEGFAITPQRFISSQDIEYQGVLGRGWLSPWVEGGQLCGSRGMALPLLGFRVRLKGQAAQMFECFYSATFVDGSVVGPVAEGEPCEAESLAPLESFQIVLQQRRQPSVQARGGSSRRVEERQPAFQPVFQTAGAQPAKVVREQKPKSSASRKGSTRR